MANPVALVLESDYSSKTVLVKKFLCRLMHDEPILMFAVINLEHCISRKVRAVFIGFRFYICWIWEFNKPGEGRAE